MAQAEHLPIYRASYDFCLYIEQVVRNFSRYHKYTLGADLRDGARRVLKLVVRANARREKAPLLLELREEVEQLKVVLRLCQDVKAFANFKAFENAIGKAVEIAKQNEAWLKHQRQGHGQSWRQWAGAWSQYAWLGVLFSRRGWQVEERWPQRRIARAGYALAVGFLARLQRNYQERALGEGIAVAVVQETGSRAVGCKCRSVVEVVVPPHRSTVKSVHRLRASSDSRLAASSSGAGPGERCWRCSSGPQTRMWLENYPSLLRGRRSVVLADAKAGIRVHALAVTALATEGSWSHSCRTGATRP